MNYLEYLSQKIAKEDEKQAMNIMLQTPTVEAKYTPALAALWAGAAGGVVGAGAGGAITTGSPIGAAVGGTLGATLSAIIGWKASKELSNICSFKTVV